MSPLLCGNNNKDKDKKLCLNASVLLKAIIGEKQIPLDLLDGMGFVHIADLRLKTNHFQRVQWTFNPMG